MFVCDVCGSSYGRQSTLREHRRLKHSQEPLLFPCETCPRAFSRKKFLMFHMNIHKNSTPFSCAKCSKQFASYYSKDRHEGKCNEKGPEKCPHCGKLNKHNQVLMDHIKTEHDNLRYTCVCGKIFKWRTSFCKHSKKCPSASKEQFSSWEMLDTSHEGDTQVDI